jgi:hypothetical protein
MQNWQIAAIVVAVVIIVAVAAWFIYKQNRSRRLRQHFGPEYDRTVSEFGDRQRAEAELARRQEHVRNLQIRPLSNVDRVHFAEKWRLCQAQFVDDPSGAVESADHLLTDIISARGYSADNPNNRLADISAAYPQHVTSYRLANEIVSRHRRGEASTEDLRKAFVHYRKLFDEILGGYDEELKRAS